MASYRRPKGTRDFIPAEMARRNAVRKTVIDTFEGYGYQEITTPLFEEFALLAKRSGEEIKEGLFTFKPGDVEYALRPEVTASVCRMLAMGEVDYAGPYKFYYFGQCYRYEQPQAGRYREFWQAGVEFFGPKSPLADAEVMAVAVRTFERAGLSPFQLKVGHIGIFRDILAERGFTEDDQNQVIGEIDRINSLREKCEIIDSKETLDSNDLFYVKTKVSDARTMLESVGFPEEYPPPTFFEGIGGEQEARTWLERLPGVVERAFERKWLDEYPGKMDAALTGLLLDISRVRGPREEVIARGEELLKDTPGYGPFTALQEVLVWLEHHGVVDYHVVLGIARGLDYYTDMVFEIDCPLLGAEKQICGGGRYDGLVADFEGPSMPACGFALGFDRLVEALQKSGEVEVGGKLDVFVATITEDLKPKAVEIAERLRGMGLRVELDTKGEKLKGQLGYASSYGASRVVICGPDELEQGCVSVRDMDTKSQELVRLEDLEGHFGPQ